MPSVLSICESSGSTTTPAHVSPHATTYEQQPPVRISSKIMSCSSDHLTPEPRDRRDRDLARHSGRPGCDPAEVETEARERAEALARDLGWAGDREPVDELVR